MLPGFIDFSFYLPSFIVCYLVLWVLTLFTEFYLVSLDVTEFLLGFDLLVPSFTGFHWILSSVSGLRLDCT